MRVRNRVPADQREIARRVAIYSRQVEQSGRIRWLPNVMDPKVRRPRGEAQPAKDD